MMWRIRDYQNLISIQTELPFPEHDEEAPSEDDHNSHHHVAKWKAAALRTRDLTDPWQELGFDQIEEESVIRHMYNPRTGKWRTDKVVIKIQSESFAHGAMRECYRMKKLSKFSQHPNWKNASNYVAKRYMVEASRKTYFDDVKLQMDSKLWGEEYSKLKVPKKVDFCQTYIIEFEGREGSPLYGVEHFIGGGYIKYNSNSGFVSDVNRLTPQTFSHFTFEKSRHSLIVVDIQGVGDLYTDPQMHTVDMKDYGEANLGTRGMALFFSSHVCNPLCELLGLTQFDLSDEELERLKSEGQSFSSSTTKISGLPQQLASDNPQLQTGNIKALKVSIDTHQQEMPEFNVSQYLESPLPLNSPLTPKFLPPDGDMCISMSPPVGSGSVEQGMSISPVGMSASVRRVKTQDTEEIDSVRHKDGDGLHVLGMIHMDLATYQEMGRFSKDLTPNLDSAMYHLTKSGHCGNVDALYSLAHVYLQLSHDRFTELSVEASPRHECVGMDYLIQAAEQGLTSAMLEVGQALDTGVGLGRAPENDPNFTATQRCQDWHEAIQWYSKVVSTSSEEGEEFLGEHNYSLLARMAEMHVQGGCGLEKDSQKAGELYTQAAESAMSAMKGKLSNKYYMLAEEAWSEIDS